MWYFIEYLVTCDSPIVVFDVLISLIKLKFKYNGMENIYIKKLHLLVKSSVYLLGWAVVGTAMNVIVS